MANITHAIRTTANISEVVSALTTLKGLDSWWTSTTSGDPSQGGTLQFRFGDHSGPDMSVEKVTKHKIIWKCISGPDEWLDTTIEFQLQDNDESGCHLMFTHRGWKNETAFHYHCSMKWASFLLSLKEFLELGTGRAFPNDIQIDGPILKRVA